MKPELRVVAEDGDSGRLRAILEDVGDIDGKDTNGQTALMLAAADGSTEAVRLLIQRGAALDIRAKFNLTALMLAIIRGHAETARLLIEAGADLTVKGGKGASGFFGKTALDLARERADIPTVEALLRARAESGAAFATSS